MPSSSVPNSAAATACNVMPYASNETPKSTPTSASMRGYCLEIGLWHQRHLPRSHSQEKTGILSRQAMGCLQFGHVERGRSSDWSRGSRRMHTLRKLPTQSPSSTTPATMTISVPTQDLVEQDPRRHGDVERLGAARQWDRDALRRDGVELRADSRSFVADDHRNELLRRRPGIECAGSGTPSAAAAHNVMRRSRAHAMKGAS